MPHVSSLHRLAALALLIAVFVVIPVADAALCGTEVQDSSLSFSIETDRHDETSLPDILQDHCEQGHCHHPTAYVVPSIPEADLERCPVHRWPDYNAAVSFMPDRLKHPPRA